MSWETIKFVGEREKCNIITKWSDSRTYIIAYNQGEKLGKRELDEDSIHAAGTRSILSSGYSHFHKDAISWWKKWWRSGTITNWFLGKDLSHLITASFHLIKFDALSPETAFHASLSSSLFSFKQRNQKEGCQWAKLLSKKTLTPR